MCHLVRGKSIQDDKEATRYKYLDGFPPVVPMVIIEL